MARESLQRGALFARPYVSDARRIRSGPGEGPVPATLPLPLLPDRTAPQVPCGAGAAGVTPLVAGAAVVAVAA
jgi:hypothetical protein